MDRLSDFVGRLIPGGYRLPPRHPLKVSLVMGLLGLVCASIAISSMQIIDIVFNPRFMGVSRYYSIGIGVLFGFGVILPRNLWHDRSMIYAVFGILISVAVTRFINLAWWLDAIAPHPSGGFINFQLATCLDILVWIIIHILLGLGIKRSFSLLGVLMIGYCFLPFMIANLCMSNIPKETYSQFTWLFSAWIHQMTCLSSLTVPMAICLGSLIWNTTPRPKFEPSESSACPPH